MAFAPVRRAGGGISQLLFSKRVVREMMEAFLGEFLNNTKARERNSKIGVMRQCFVWDNASLPVDKTCARLRFWKLRGKNRKSQGESRKHTKTARHMMTKMRHAWQEEAL